VYPKSSRAPKVFIGFHIRIQTQRPKTQISKSTVGTEWHQVLRHQSLLQDQDAGYLLAL